MYVRTNEAEADLVIMTRGTSTYVCFFFEMICTYKSLIVKIDVDRLYSEALESKVIQR